MTVEKFCLDCGEKLSGRADKKFCNDLCRNNYNNHLNSDSTSLMKNINNILRKNRRILLEILPAKEDKTKISGRTLEDKGFNFNYHTHLYVTKSGNTYHFCYETGYLPLEHNYYMIVRRNRDTG